MVVQRLHLYIGLFVALAVLVILVQQGVLHINRAATKKDLRSSVVANCTRGSERAALFAAQIRQSSSLPVDKAYAAAIVATIPVPAGNVGDEAVFGTEKVEDQTGRIVIRLTEAARMLQKEGCEQSS